MVSSISYRRRSRISSKIFLQCFLPFLCILTSFHVSTRLLLEQAKSESNKAHRLNIGLWQLNSTVIWIDPIYNSDTAH
jgi:hypothetical protein